MKDIANHYPLLTADERFRLFIEAASRRDDQELDRLNYTCPRKTYSSEDGDYTRRKVRFFDLALLHANEVANTDCGAFAALTLLLAYGDDPAPDGTPAKLKDVLVTLTGQRLSMIEGWNRFCSQLGLSAASVGEFLSLFGRNCDWLMAALDHAVADATALDLEPDESQVEAWHGQWLECWGE